MDDSYNSALQIYNEIIPDKISKPFLKKAIGYIMAFHKCN